MMGNCWEPCSDFRSPGIPYEPRLAIDPLGPPRSTQSMNFAMRGGCCVSTIKTLRTAFRGTHGASSSDDSHGIRFACDIVGNIPPVLIAREPPTFSLTAEAAQALLNSR